MVSGCVLTCTLVGPLELWKAVCTWQSYGLTSTSEKQWLIGEDRHSAYVWSNHECDHERCTIQSRKRPWEMYDLIKNVAMRDVRSNQECGHERCTIQSRMWPWEMYDLIKSVAMRMRRLTDCLIKVKHLEKDIHSNCGCSIKVNVKVT